VGALSATSAAFAAKSDSKGSSRVIGANDRINVGVIGYGGRGSYVANQFARFAEKNKDACRISAVCDVFERRRKQGADKYGVKGYIDYREMLAGETDLDAVIVATPDHWHGKIAVDAMDKGKDVYLEKPMTYTVDEAKEVADAVKTSGRVLQVGSQYASMDHFWKARKAIKDGLLGDVVWASGGFGRNRNLRGEWNYAIDPDATEKTLDWKAFLGSAPKRPFDPERYFRWRKYWDYSGGIATDLFYHALAPLVMITGQEFPARVTASGGIFVQKDREVPDTFLMNVDYSSFTQT
jgi:predicted dehydrogenase